MQSIRPGRRRSRLEQGYWGFILIMPWLIGFLIFKAYPFLSSLYYSFTDWNLFKGGSWIGIQNYVTAFTTAKNLKALRVTFIYAFMTVPLKLAFALFIAYILNFKIKGVGLFRTAYYIPSILGGSMAIAVLWRAMFKNDGVVNRILTILGLDNVNFLADKTWALVIICLLRVWQFGSPMVLFLAALKGVPEELYEAASIDGATSGRQFVKITLPLISPVIFYNLVTQLVQAFQEFNGPYIITQGGPRNATTLISLIVYNSAFSEYNVGMSSAMAWIMFVIVMIFTAISFSTQKKWVYYSDERGDK
ncbi:MAG: sugar ABC transporter permease [Clostridia bacterium]|nr:sugar ABC transporter permease [Clostridia bacterium]MBR6890299.1 sugar ABC transporter permease [Clostridia bacterium]